MVDDLKCPVCQSKKVELDDEYCELTRYYCEDCGTHFTEWGNGSISIEYKGEAKCEKENQS